MFRDIFHLFKLPKQKMNFDRDIFIDVCENSFNLTQPFQSSIWVKFPYNEKYMEREILSFTIHEKEESKIYKPDKDGIYSIDIENIDWALCGRKDGVYHNTAFLVSFPHLFDLEYDNGEKVSFNGKIMLENSYQCYAGIEEDMTIFSEEYFGEIPGKGMNDINFELSLFPEKVDGKLIVPDYGSKTKSAY